MSRIEMLVPLFAITIWVVIGGFAAVLGLWFSRQGLIQGKKKLSEIEPTIDDVIVMFFLALGGPISLVGGILAILLDAYVRSGVGGKKPFKRD